MSTIEIPTEDAVAMVRAIRDRHYEATKNMTADEKWEYDCQRLERARRTMAEVNPDDYDLSWLTSEPLMR